MKKLFLSIALTTMFTTTTANALYSSSAVIHIFSLIGFLGSIVSYNDVCPTVPHQTACKVGVGFFGFMFYILDQESNQVVFKKIDSPVANLTKDEFDSYNENIDRLNLAIQEVTLDTSTTDKMSIIENALPEDAFNAFKKVAKYSISQLNVNP